MAQPRNEGAAARLLVADLDEASAAALGRHADVAGLAVLTSLSTGDARPGVLLTAYPVDRMPTVRTSTVVAVGRDVDADMQAIAMRRGATDILDLAWAPALIVARLIQLAEREGLRDRLAADLAAKERELADARALQLALVPPPGEDTQVAIDVVLEPALELGGDLVDYLRIADGRIMIALGDVSGKGAAAALTMARTHTLLRSLALRSYAGELLSPPDTAARRLNGMLAIENDGCMFVTLFLALFDPVGGALDYVRCGQIPPFLRRADGTIERLDTVGGLPLGVFEDVGYDVGHTTLLPGDALLVVSDGVTEAEAPDGRLLGEQPVVDWLTTAPRSLAPLVALTRTHEAGNAASDDLSAILVRVRADSDGSRHCRTTGAAA